MGFVLSTPPTLDCGECREWIFDRQTGEKERRKTEEEKEQRCPMCPRWDDLSFSATALTLWAVEVYGFLDPEYAGRLPAYAMDKFTPKEFDALRIVRSAVAQWRAQQRHGKT